MLRMKGRNRTKKVMKMTRISVSAKKTMKKRTKKLHKNNMRMKLLKNDLIFI